MFMNILALVVPQSAYLFFFHFVPKGTDAFHFAKRHLVFIQIVSQLNSLCLKGDILFDTLFFLVRKLI